MAIISCPSCNKRISSAAKTCQFCKSSFDDSFEDEKLMREMSNKRFSKMQRIQNLSFLAVLLFAGGSIMMYFGIKESDNDLADVGRIMLSTGFIGYIIARVMTFMAKTRKK